MHAVVSGDELDAACAVAFLDAAAFVVAAVLAFAGQLIGEGAGAISGFALSGNHKNQMEMPGGPCYQWSRKVRKKTVSVALSKEQYEWLVEAIENWRRVQGTLKEMQKLSRQVLFETVPNPRRRKALGKKVLGLI